jgi:hypothetical protein
MGSWRSVEGSACALPRWSGPACFLLGAAAGHIYPMIVAPNFEPGNAGVIFYTDVGIPAISLVLLWPQHRFGREPPAPGTVPGAVGTPENPRAGKA